MWAEVVDEVADMKDKRLEDAIRKVRGQALRELQGIIVFLFYYFWNKLLL